MHTSNPRRTHSPYAAVLRGSQDFLVRVKTFSNSLPRKPDSSALRTLCRTTGQRLQRGLLRPHFFFGLIPTKLLDFTGSFRDFRRFRDWIPALRQSWTWILARTFAT
jgi:hypothetical protein